MGLAINTLRKMVAEIPDDHVREKQGKAVEAWIASSPKRTVWRDCPGCGERGHDRTGRLCMGCMEAIVRNAIHATKKEGMEGKEAVAILTTAHHNENIPHLETAANVMEDTRFYRGREKGGYDSAHSTLRHLVTEFGQLCLSGYPTVPSGMQKSSILGGFLFEAEHVSGMAPLGFGEKLRELLNFIAWCTLNSKQEGLSQGQNLLVQLSAGTMTHEYFTEKTMELERRSVEKIEAIQRKRKS